MTRVDTFEDEKGSLTVKRRTDKKDHKYNKITFPHRAYTGTCRALLPLRSVIRVKELVNAYA